MNREDLLQEMENLWDIEILWLWGQLYKGKKKGGRGRKGRLKVTEHCRSYSNSFKNYQVGASKQNIDANEEAAEPPLPPVVTKKVKLDSWCFPSVLSVLKKACKNDGGELLGGLVATGYGLMVLNWGRLVQIRFKFFTMCVMKHWHRLPRGAVAAPSLKTSKVSDWMGFGAIWSRGPRSQQEGLSGWALKDPFQPRLLCYSVTANS